jgi:hypothetical protein
MSPSTAPPFCSFTRTARMVPLMRPQTVTFRAITLPSFAPSQTRRSEAHNSPSIRPKTCAGLCNRSYRRLHQANIPSGGQTSQIELQTFSQEDTVRSNKMHGLPLPAAAATPSRSNCARNAAPLKFYRPAHSVADTIPLCITRAPLLWEALSRLADCAAGRRGVANRAQHRTILGHSARASRSRRNHSAR